MREIELKIHDMSTTLHPADAYALVLEEALALAVEKEDYEQASHLRDEIRRRKEEEKE